MPVYTESTKPNANGSETSISHIAGDDFCTLYANERWSKNLAYRMLEEHPDEIDVMFIDKPTTDSEEDDNDSSSTVESLTAEEYLSSLTSEEALKLDKKGAIAIRIPFKCMKYIRWPIERPNTTTDENGEVVERPKRTLSEEQKRKMQEARKAKKAEREAAKKK